ncbi:MAG: hypothetical protein ACRDR6_03435 [Pseudonocardiaceae bacterium]
MNTRGVMLAVGAIMVIAGVLIELAGYYCIGDRTNTGEASRTLRPLSGPVAASGENSPLPVQETTPREVQTMADDPYLAVH